jgi:ribosomal protein S12 methylthiotransferase accessory factor
MKSLAAFTKDEMSSLEASRFRKCAPGETFAKISPYFRHLGITRVASQTGLDKIGIPVWCAYTPNAKAIVIAQGKGLDDESARTSAVMEAVERTIATQPACEIISSSFSQLQAKSVPAHQMDCLLAARNKPIQKDEIISWAKSRELRSGGTMWVPFDAVCFDRTVLSPRFWLSTDGLASGNIWEEAVLHGLLERVERDALALWSIDAPAKRFQSRIELSSLQDDSIQIMLEKIAAAGLEIALFDISSDLEVPCISALLGPAKPFNTTPRHVDVTLGAGASPCPLIAASRAISEAVQSRMTFIAGARDDLMPEIFSQGVDPGLLQAFMAPEKVSLDQMPHLAVSDTKDALERLVAHLSKHGIDQLFAVDLTPDWLPVSVVKVLAPQLESPDGDRRQRFGSRALSRRLQ